MFTAAQFLIGREANGSAGGLTHFDPFGAEGRGLFFLDPYADPEQEKLLWRQRSKDHDGSAKPLESSSGKVRKAPFRGQRKSRRTFVISRSPVQVRPVAPSERNKKDTAPKNPDFVRVFWRLRRSKSTLRFRRYQTPFSANWPDLNRRVSRSSG